MQSDGVGKMLLYVPNGSQIPGFEQVVFAKCASEKLASVGELCDAGMVCVFDKEGLRTCKNSDCKVIGKFLLMMRGIKNQNFILSHFFGRKKRMLT